MIEELAQLDSYWRKVAFRITGCKQLADEIVQLMYLKMHDKCRPEINNLKPYIARTLYHLFIDEKRRTKRFTPIEYVEVSVTPEYDDDIKRIVNKALEQVDEEVKEAMLLNMDDTVRGTAVKMKWSAYKLWSKVKQGKEQMKQDKAIKQAYNDLKKGEL